MEHCAERVHQMLVITAGAMHYTHTSTHEFFQVARRQGEVVWTQEVEIVPVC